MKSKSVMFVNPVKRQSAQGRHTNTHKVRDPNTGEVVSQKPINRSQSKGSTTTLSFNIDRAKGKLVTGLEEVIENPFKDQDKSHISSKYSLSTEWDKYLDDVIKSDEITKQTYFEILAGVEPDYYTSNIKADMLGASFGVKDVELTYLQKYKIILYPKPNRFTSENPRGRLAMQLLKHQRRVAKSIDDINSATHLYYISEENEAEERALARKEKIAKGYYSLEKLKQEYTDYDRYKVATVLRDRNGVPIIKGRISDMAVKEALFKYIDTDNISQLVNINYLVKRVEQLKSVESSDNLYVDYLFQLALNNNIIIARDGKTIWVSKRDKPSIGEFTSEDTFKAFIRKEYDNYSPKGKETNFYGEFIEEIKAKGGWIE